MPPFFPSRVGKRKRAAISKQSCFSQKRVRSYIVLALNEFISYLLSEVAIEAAEAKMVETVDAEAAAVLVGRYEAISASDSEVKSSS